VHINSRHFKIFEKKFQELLELGAGAVWHTTVSAMPCDDTEAGAKWHGFDAMHWCCGLPKSLQTSPWFRMVECF
jgi:hypothetical protein